MKNRFDDIGYDDFRRMASDPDLSPYEQIGFPDSYRKGFENAIFKDICLKADNLLAQSKHVLDIGPGCSGLSHMLIEHCENNNHSLTMVDSEEMLSRLPEGGRIRKIPGFYPDCFNLISNGTERFDVIICYSVLHYIFVEASFWRFLDCSIKLLAPGGQFLIGDIPNISKRKRFFSSDNGIRFHKEFMKTDKAPVVERDVVETDKIDDGVLLGLIMRARAEGCDAYWLPQPGDLPMANRREDILIIKA